MKSALSRFLPLLIAFLAIQNVYSEPTNLSFIKKEIKTYHDSGLYEKDLTQTISKAHQFLISQVQLNKNNQKLALVLDIDETSLSNYDKMAQYDFGYDKQQFHKAIQAADAPAIAPMLALYSDAVKHGVKVFFVTGRPETERNATQKNLLKAGYKNWSGLYLKPDNYKEKSIIPFKSHTREAITKQGYVIVATIGDQFSDIKGGYAMKGFKLPNPYYYLP